MKTNISLFLLIFFMTGFDFIQAQGLADILKKKTFGMSSYKYSAISGLDQRKCELFERGVCFLQNKLCIEQIQVANQRNADCGAYAVATGGLVINQMLKGTAYDKESGLSYDSILNAAVFERVFASWYENSSEDLRRDLGNKKLNNLDGMGISLLSDKYGPKYETSSGEKISYPIIILDKEGNNQNMQPFEEDFIQYQWNHKDLSLPFAAHFVINTDTIGSQGKHWYSLVVIQNGKNRDGIYFYITDSLRNRDRKKDCSSIAQRIKDAILKSYTHC